MARIELGAQTYNLKGRLNGKPAAVMALYQLPGSNALEAAAGRQGQAWPSSSRTFRPTSTTRSPSTPRAPSPRACTRSSPRSGRRCVLVILVVFIFLQGWRATLIPLLAVPVSLIGAFILFPVFGFSVNTLSLFGLVLAIGLVVDDAIVVVEAWSATSRKACRRARRR